MKNTALDYALAVSIGLALAFIFIVELSK